MNAPVPPPVTASTPLDAPAAAAKPIVLDVSGMTCAACAARIEKVLSRTPGVTHAAVNLALERAEVVAPGVAPAEIVAAIERTGFGAVPRAEEAKARRAAREAREAADRAETRRTFALFAFAALLTLPFWIGMVPMAWGGHAAWLTPSLQLALATPVQIVAGWRFYTGAWKALRSGGANMDVLVALGTTTAYVFSAAMVAIHGDHAHGHLYFEGSATVITLVLLGKLLEARAKRGAAAALTRLASLRPDQATRLTADGTPETIGIDLVRPGDRVLVKPGERVPVDGTVIEGESEVDESLVTGESLPVSKAAGARVTTGTVNGPGPLIVGTVAVGEDTTLARVTRLVEAAQLSKAPVQRLVDRISAVFVPVVVAIAAVTFAAWLATGAGAEEAMVHAVAVLVIACPCALGLATPTALVAGTGAAARAGILVRDIEALERALAVDTVVFDKTGTLTEGRPAVTDVVGLGVPGAEVLRLAASAQGASEHPLGLAMRRAAEVDGLALAPVVRATNRPGRGVVAEVEGRRLAVGNLALMDDLGIDVKLVAAEKTRLEGEAKTTTLVARDGEVLGLVALADPVRAASRDAVAELARRGIATRLLTGDSRPVAAAVAARLGIGDVEADVKPEGKAGVVAKLRREGRVVAMVGDGVNDAPALAGADVGIAVGTGADVAVETAPLTLMRPDPRLVPAALDVSRATVAKIRQNLFWAFVYNVVGLPLAAFGLLSPAFAGFAMAMSSVSVVSNAWLLTRWRPKGT